MPEEDFEQMMEASQRATKRVLDKMKRQAVEKRRKEESAKLHKEAQEQVQKLVKKLAKKMGMRTTSWAAGATGIGLIVTYFIWTGQAIVGNLLGSKWIPGLDWWELILWALLSILMLIIVIGTISVFTLAFIFTDPVEAAKLIAEWIGDYVWDFFFK